MLPLFIRPAGNTALDTIPERKSLIFKLTFPYNSNAITQCQQLCLNYFIPFYICSKFLFPKIDIALRLIGVFAVPMPVPEASMQKHRRLGSHQEYVRSTGQSFHIPAYFIPALLAQKIKLLFRACPFAPYAGHIPTSVFNT